ncbi:MAG: glucuronate isomerase [Pseudomonadota bacterium]
MPDSAPLFAPDTLLPDPLAQALYADVSSLPLICSHGHTDPAWFASDAPFSNPAELIVIPDHYVLRMLVSQGHRLEDLGVARRDGAPVETDPRTIWRRFASAYHLFRGTPSRLWLDYTFDNLFGLTEPLTAQTADRAYDNIAAQLEQPNFRPRALFDSFHIEALATTDSALDPLTHHRAIADSEWSGRVIPTYRPDTITDPDAVGFASNLDRLSDLTGCDTGRWDGYLEAHRIRRQSFKDHGATATDHGVPTPRTADLSKPEAAALFDRVRTGKANPEDADLFRAQMLTEMARMSLDDGLVMQLHAGSHRNHHDRIFQLFGPDKGFDIPTRVDWVTGLGPLLNAVGMDPRLTLLLFTLDESSYARELAPLAGVYPCLRLGPAWWFHDSPEGMRRFREMTTETAGFYNTVGFNDDTRAFPSIPARHDIARRVDCAFLSRLVRDRRLREDEARELAHDLTYALPKAAYRLDG